LAKANELAELAEEEAEERRANLVKSIAKKDNELKHQ